MELARIRKRLLCVLLALSIVVTAEYTAYKEIPRVEAVAAETVSFILLMLALAGYSVSMTSVLSNGGDYIDWQIAAGQAEDTLERLWNNAVAAYEAGQLDGSYNLGDDENDPNNNPLDWDSLKEWVVNNGGKIAVTVGGALASVLLYFRYQIYVKNSLLSQLPDEWDIDEYPISSMLEYIDEYPYYLLNHRAALGASSVGIYMFDSIPCIYAYSGSFNYKYFRCFYYDGKDYVKYLSAYNSEYDLTLHYDLLDDGYINDAYPYAQLASVKATTTTDICTNIGSVIWSTDDAADTVPSIADNDSDTNVIGPDNIVPSSGLQESIDNNGDSNSYPVATSGVMPTDDQIEDYVQALTDSIDTEEDPDADPDTDPDTDPGTDFIDDITTPGLDESDPDDDDDVSNVDPDDETVQAKLSLFLLPEWITKRFPFCIPFDLVESFTALDSETRTAPYYELPLKAENYGIDEVLVIDLSEYDEVAELLRTLELLLFIVGLILATRSLIRG